MLALLVAGCSVGQGRGGASGNVTAVGCGLRDQMIDIRPTFFAAEVTGDTLNIQIQRGSNIEEFSDGLYIQVRDTTEIDQHRLGLPIEVTSDYGAPVQMVLYLNETCDAGFPHDHRVPATVLQATAGTVQFDAIYAPEIDPGAVKIQGHFDDVQLVGSNAADENGTLSGFFSFFYQRGAPAQRFP